MASQDRIRLLDDLCDVMERASLCQLGGMTYSRAVSVAACHRRIQSDK